MSHTIEDLSFYGGWVECACGVTVTGGTDDELAVEFRAHRLSTPAPHGLKLRAPHGPKFTIIAKHQRNEPRREDPVVGYLLSMNPLT